MDPLTAIGLASAIVQFIDFSSSLVSGAREIHSSVSGAKAELVAADQAIDRLKILTRQLPHFVATQALTPDDERLLALKQGCEGVSEELRKILEAGRAKDPGSKRSSLQASWRTIRNKDKVAKLESRLDRYRDEVLGVLQAMISDDTSETKKLLESLMKAQPKFAESLRQDLARTRDSIIDAIKIELSMNNNQQQSRAQAQQASLSQIQSDLTSLLETAKDIPVQDAVLDLLWYEGITSRQRSIDSAHKATFRWLLYERESRRSDHVFEYGDDSNLSRDLAQDAYKRTEKRETFITWLKTGSGVFYISGKAGAGKSTLMKYLSQEEKTRHELQAWAESGGKQLILARFFFWSTGDQLQKSYRGLYRALLWDILRQSPDLIESAFADIWRSATIEGHNSLRHHSFDLEDLRAALNRLLTSPTTTERYKVCIFIDGLDEFDGDHWRLSKTLSTWASTDGIKFCVSSRPYNAFKEIFASDQSRYLQIHELTRQDMLEFARSEFQDDDRSLVTRAEKRLYSNLVRELVDRSDGIFLWARLVTYELLKAMGNHCSSKQLRERLHKIPRGLDGLFKQMFDAIDMPERTRAAQMLLIMKLPTAFFTNKWVGTHAILDILMDNPPMLDSVLSGGPRTGALDWENCCQTVTPRLMARCNGLVELKPPNETPALDRRPWVKYLLQFVHRSVSDFLEDPQIHGELLRLAGSFCPWEAFFRAKLAEIMFYNIGDFYVLKSIKAAVRIQGEAERLGIPPFTKGMGSLIQMCRKLAEAKEDGCLTIWGGGKIYQMSGSSIYADDDEMAIPFVDIESAIMCSAFYSGCINYTSEWVAQNTALMFPKPCGSNFLLHAALNDLHRSSARKEEGDATTGRDYYTEMKIPRILNIDDSLINTTSYSCWDRNGDSYYFPNPPWTTWTSFLYALGLFYQDETRGNKHQRVISRLIQEFLAHGADPAACFILSNLRKIRQVISNPQLINEFNISDTVFYATLPAMIGKWGLSITPEIRQHLDTRCFEPEWNLANMALSLLMLRATKSQRLAIRQLNPDELAVGGFIPIKVVTFRQLQAIQREDLKGAFMAWEGDWQPREYKGPEIRT